MKSEVRSPKSEANRFLVCFALQEEARPFRRLAGKRSGISVLVTGVGRQNTRAALGQALALGRPEGVLTCGFAGGLNADLEVGDVVFSTQDAVLRERLMAAGAEPARFCCANRIATTSAEKATLRQTTGADAVEMESEAIQALCRERGIPCATVRVISDTAGEDLPLDFNQLAGPDLALDCARLTLALARSPGRIRALLRLQGNCRRAAAKLATTLAAVV